MKYIIIVVVILLALLIAGLVVRRKHNAEIGRLEKEKMQKKSSRNGIGSVIIIT